MRSIGITGGSTLYELGTATDVQLFFDCLDTYIVQKSSAEDWQILTDRFYKKYLALDDLVVATLAMEKVRKIFQELPSNSIDWDELQKHPEETKLNLQASTLADIFSHFFNGFAASVDSAKLNYEAFKSYIGYRYEPVRIVVADAPWFIAEKNRPLTDYDKLDGKPFWLST